MPEDLSTYKFLFDSARLGIIIQNEKGVIIKANKAAEKILGYTKNTLNKLHLKSECWQGFNEDNEPVSGIDHPCMKALTSGKPVENEIMGFIHPRSKKHTWLSINAIPKFRDGDKKPSLVYSIITDITEEFETRKSLEQFKKAVDSSTNAVGLSTPEGKHFYQNHAFDNLFGDIGTDSSASLYVNKETGRKVFQTVISGKEWIGEVEMYGKQKEILNIQLRAYSVKDSQGKLIGLVGVYNDITAKKRAEKELIESKEKLRIALEGAHADSWEMDLKTGRLTFSDKWARFLGYRKGDISKTIEAVAGLIHPDDYPRNMERLQMHLDGKADVYETETRLRKKNGEYIWLLSRGKVIERNSKGEPVRLAGTNFDITESKRAKQALQESEQMFRQLADESPNMIFINQGDKVVYANKICENLTKYSLHEFYSPDFNFMVLIDPSDHKKIKKNFASHKRGKEINPYEYKLITKDGSMLDVIINTKLILYKHKPAILGIVTDITERIKIESTLQTKERFLQKSLAELETIINALPGMVSVVDRDFNVLVANEEVIRIFGQNDTSEVIGQKCYKTRKGLDQPCPQCGLVEAYKTGKTISRISTPEEEELMGIVTQAYAVPMKDDKDEIWGGVEVIMDITELRKAEIAMQKSERKFRHMIEHGAECITLIDASGKVTYESPTVVLTTGYTHEERKGKNALELIHKDDLPGIRKILSTIAKTPGVSHNAQFRAIKKNGEIWWVSGTITNLLHDPSVSALVVNYRDITKQKEAELELRESEHRFRTLIEQAGDAVYLSDIQGRIVNVNKKTCEQTGYSREELLQKTVMELDHEYPTLKECLSIWNNLEEGKSISFESHHQRKDGSLLPVEINTSSIEINGEKHILGFVRDITERKKAEEAIMASEERFRRMFEEGQFGITIAGPDFKFITANQAFCDMIGYNVEELTKLSFAEITKPDQLDVSTEQVIALKEGRIKHIKLEKEYLRKDGKLFWGSLISTPIRDRKGNILHYLDMVEDITKLKNTQEALENQISEYQKLTREYKHQNRELERTLKDIRKINLELEHAKQKAVESDSLKTAFLANMSHEIRTPMNGILGFTDLLKQTDLTGDEKARYLEVIQQSGNRMLSIINDLIDISKIEAGQVEVDISPTDINFLMDNFHTFFRPEAEHKNLLLTCTKGLSSKECIIETDETKVGQVISNLIKNALKFTQAGKIEFGYIREKDELVFFVQDTGPGIDEDSIDIIFERFRQGNQQNNKALEGSGLGLSISRAFIEMLGGKIRVESKVGKGSKFLFTLPYKPVAVKSDKTMSDRKSRNQAEGIRILIAEDDESSTFYLKEALKHIKAELFYAVNGLEAIETVKNHPDLNLVLMDIKMPVLNGLEATSQIKKLRPDLPVIAQTAFASMHDNQRALDAGCDDYIIKPIHKQLLLEIVRKYVFQP